MVMESDRPQKHWDLSDWRWFAFSEFGEDSPAFLYLDGLCKSFGVDFKDLPDKDIFFDHIAKLNNERTVRPYEGKV